MILARGLGLPQLLYHCIAQYAASSQLVFVLNVSEDVQREINERLTLDRQQNVSPPSSASPSPSTSPAASPTLTSTAAHPPVLRSITNQVNQAERQKLYLQGGCLAITTRILIVDLLNKLVAPDLINGLILNAAHRTTEDSTEAFILRIYRQHNSRGFLKAFSDEPHHFAAGFFGLDKVMRTLHCRCLLLYPRFHLSVQGSLSEGGMSSPDVHEMYQPLTSSMDGIQRALLECMDHCISALKQENRIGSSLLAVTVETGLTKAFDSIIRHELDPIWSAFTHEHANAQLPRPPVVDHFRSLSHAFVCLCTVFLSLIGTKCRRAHISWWPTSPRSASAYRISSSTTRSRSTATCSP